MLHYYQSKWEELHSQNEGNAKRAEEVDVLIAGLQSYCHQQLVSMQQLNLQLAQLPKLQQGVQDLMNTIGELEGMFEEVELRLVSLEDVIETQALQEKQLDERFKLALYGEKKKGHFESLKAETNWKKTTKRCLDSWKNKSEKCFEKDKRPLGKCFAGILKHTKNKGHCTESKLCTTHKLTWKTLTWKGMTKSAKR